MSFERWSRDRSLARKLEMAAHDLLRAREEGKSGEGKTEKQCWARLKYILCKIQARAEGGR